MLPLTPDRDGREWRKRTQRDHTFGGDARGLYVKVAEPIDTKTNKTPDDVKTAWDKASNVYVTKHKTGLYSIMSESDSLRPIKGMLSSYLLCIIPIFYVIIFTVYYSHILCHHIYCVLLPYFLSSYIYILEIHTTKPVNNACFLRPKTRIITLNGRKCGYDNTPMGHGGLSKLMQEIADDFGLDKCSLYGMKKTVATAARKHGVNAEVIQNITHHSTMETEKYFQKENTKQCNDNEINRFQEILINGGKHLNNNIGSVNTNSSILPSAVPSIGLLLTETRNAF